MMLTRDKWNAARTFIFSHARPLEQKLFNYHFENGSKEDAVNELTLFQNNDGGFGKCLEPDFRLEISSPMATTVGLQIAADLQLEKDHPVISKAMSYLESVYEDQEETWHAVPPEINEVPHAPWWHFDHEKGYCGVQTTWANPNAEIVGYYQLFNQEEPLLEKWTKRSREELSKLPRPLGKHDFLCYSRLLQTLSVCEETKQYIDSALSQAVHETVCKDLSRWDEYVAKPLDAAPEPSSPFYEHLKKEINLQLDYEIKSQDVNGYWQPAWSWFGQYEETWKKAEVEWRGIITLSTLRSLAAYERIEWKD
ncbi:hypothetical protein [Rossellomorea aquimaris]|uniref:Uncharacterized protein n=1 Tax=Rossellomorea aquimaris TaxID=189382 RepID=A0A1J6W3D1_9BACI|nr:hypothetical protein [Rossellomorea aquimaris]OIU72058.1 hypothetical protein BHE18_05325 [Rossellomorea aquimaris]